MASVFREVASTSILRGFRCFNTEYLAPNSMKNPLYRIHVVNVQLSHYQGYDLQREPGCLLCFGGSVGPLMSP